MTLDTSTGNTSSKAFKIYPEFTNLGYADRAKYEKLISDFPPVSSISFANLMIWWNDFNSCAISQLNDNLIISFWIPGSEEMTGLAVIGTKKLDETICEVFDHLRQKGEEPRIVHIPDFVLANLEHPELFSCTPEPPVDEYILAVSKFYPLRQIVSVRRLRVRKFQKRHPEDAVVVKNLDLEMPEHKKLLLESAEQWRPKGLLKNFVKHMDDAMLLAINDASLLGTQCLCLFIDDILEAFMLYFETSDKRYVTLSHALFSGETPGAFDYALYGFAKSFADKGVSYVNIDSDLGIPTLRMLKVALGPDHYFRYYTVQPV